ncbi:MAG: proton-conducting transporter membrane subunit [Longimicrobiales bacterium]|jgi:multicomponent Na+:H+ antiporter subunit D|nr:proton-conducting transporter membrane subunit [Longimicrobiales bacterium]
MTYPQILCLIVAIPFMGAGLILLAGKYHNLRDTLSLLVAMVLCGTVYQLIEPLRQGNFTQVTLLEVTPSLSLGLSVEPLGLLFALVASFLWIVTGLYAIGYMRGHHEKNQTRFFACFAIAIGGAMGVSFSSNLFTLFAFYELLTLCTFPLVTHHGTDEAKKAGRIYLGILLATSVGLQLFAIIWTWNLAGTLDFRPNGILAGTASNRVLSILIVLFVFGVGKAAVMPFHRWLPAAMVAPTPVSALLHAVAVVKVGVFTILKVAIYIFGLDTLAQLGSTPWLRWIVAATIILGSLVAFTKDNLKARLAYSTISQLSYIVLAALLANEFAIIGGGMHIAMHAFGKITLFFAAGSVLVASHKTNISDMKGLGRRMPLTFAAFFVGSLSIIGVPPAGGAWSKWFLGLGTIEAGEQGLLAVLMVSSLLSLVYLLEVPIRAFFSSPEPDQEGTGIQEAPWPCLLAMGISGGMTVGLFLFPDFLYEMMTMVFAA